MRPLEKKRFGIGAGDMFAPGAGDAGMVLVGVEGGPMPVM
jgi:hypothetical protein